MPRDPRPRPGLHDLLSGPGGRTFLWLWLGQLVSGFGSTLTAFALGLYLFERTGQATPLALSVLAGYLPGILLGPVAGVFVDRIDRRWALIGSDVAQALVTLALLLLLRSTEPSVLWIYALLALGSVAGTVQGPASSATVALLVAPAHLGRANGMLSFGEGFGTLLAPGVAGLLITLVGVQAVLAIDALTFLFSAGVLLPLTLPRPPVAAARPPVRQALWPEIRAGWSFIRGRSGLSVLLLVGSLLNLIGIFVTARLNTPLVLARSGGDASALGLVSSAFGLGLLLGGAIMATWGGPRPRVYGALGGVAALGLVYQLLFGLSQTLLGWLLCSLLGGLLIPIQSGSANAIWQAQVPADLQGRVFAVRRTLGQILAPVGLLMIGPLADRVAAPLLQGPAGPLLASLVGQGTGAPFALVLASCGLLSLLLAALALSLPAVRRVEDVPVGQGRSTNSKLEGGKTRF